jgi:hypothetical protein
LIPLRNHAAARSAAVALALGLIMAGCGGQSSVPIADVPEVKSPAPPGITDAALHYVS